MKYIIASALISLILSPALLHAEDIGTTQDRNGHIVFLYNNEPSIKIAPKSSAYENSNCTPSYEGALRYNTRIKTLEFCNGSIWTRFMPKEIKESDPINIDYKSCTPARNLGSNPYGTGRLSGISLMCPRNYIIVASDDAKDTSYAGEWGQYNAAYCCKMKIGD